MTETITVGFTHALARRDGASVTTECGRVFTGIPGWADQGMRCPTCYDLPDTIYGVSPRGDAPITYKQRTK